MKSLSKEEFERYKSDMLDAWYIMRCANLCQYTINGGICKGCPYDYDSFFVQTNRKII